MDDQRPLSRRAKFIMLMTFMGVSLAWPKIVPAADLVSYTYICSGVVLAGLGFHALVDYKKASVNAPDTPGSTAQ